MPAGAALELAPLGRAGAGAFGDDGVDAPAFDGSVGAVVGARALADVQDVGGDLHAVGGSCCGLAAGADGIGVDPAINSGAAARDGDQVVRVGLALGDGRDLRLAGLAGRAGAAGRAGIVLAAAEGDDVADLQAVRGAAGGLAAGAAAGGS